MNFRPELAAKVMAGEKTVTRRLTSTNPNSPWWKGGCSLKVAKDYAVCPGRGKHAIGRAVVTSVALERLRLMSDAEARREGFATGWAFMEAFAEINGVYDLTAKVWRIGLWAIPPGVTLTPDERADALRRARAAELGLQVLPWAQLQGSERAMWRQRAEAPA